MPGILQQASALIISLSNDPIVSKTVPSKLQTYGDWKTNNSSY